MRNQSKGRKEEKNNAGKREEERNVPDVEAIHGDRSDALRGNHTPNQQVASQGLTHLQL